jgi:head-tail adaptor
VSPLSQGDGVTAGARDRKITVQRFTTGSEDAFGAPIEAWADHAGFWAAVFYGSGSERREAGLEGADRVATFEVDYGATAVGVTVADRIIDDQSNTWDITGTAQDRAKGKVMWTATERASQ